MDKLIIDIYEKESMVPHYLRKLGVPFIYARLPVGDYSIFDRIVIERKTSGDFASSIKTKRLFKQMMELSEISERPLLVIEGRELYNVKGVHKKGILGALSLITVYYGIPTVFTNNSEETALFLYLLYKRETSEERGLSSIFFKKKVRTREEEILRIVESIPGIGPKFAKNLINQFKNLSSLFSASEEELKRIPGIGETRAKKLREIFISNYGEQFELFGEKNKKYEKSS